MMEPYKISFQYKSKYIRWFKWASIALGIIYGALFWVSFTGNASTFDWVVHLVSAIFWVSVGTGWFIERVFPYPEITVSDDGIKYGRRNKFNNLTWAQICEISIDNNSLVLHLENNRREELNIAYLQYNQLQTAKEKFRQFSQTHDVAYASKY